MEPPKEGGSQSFLQPFNNLNSGPKAGEDVNNSFQGLCPSSSLVKIKLCSCAKAMHLKTFFSLLLLKKYKMNSDTEFLFVWVFWLV